MANDDYRLGSVDLSGLVHPVLVVGEGFYSLASLFGTGPGALLSAFHDWPANSKKLDEVVRARSYREWPIDGQAVDSICTPLMYPAKVICAGANYYDHIEEMGFENVPKSESQPYFFFKPPTTTLVGPGDTVEYPQHSEKFDWEIEIAAIIGRKAKSVSVENALDIVGAYALSIDLTARDLQLTAPDLFRIDWYTGKAQDTTCPLGPWLTPASLIGNPDAIDLALKVNEETMQTGDTGGMIFSMAELVSHASQYLTLEPGDVIQTGSPAGVGYARDRFLWPGDRLTAYSSALGELTVSIRK